ncbi:MAG TPA: cation diffusion facilitator family transporter [Streptosporangiales bacterium]
MGGGHHDHGIGIDADRRYLAGALVLIVAFMVAEVVVGVLVGSLALVTDAGHMLTDAAAIALALVAIRLAARPAAGSYTFGLKRAEILSAQANGITLLVLVAYFCYEAVRRLVVPPDVAGIPVVVTAVAGIVVNLLVVVLLRRASRRSLAIEGAFQHILNDLFAFAGTAVAGIVVWLTGWTRADAVAALVVAALMARAGYGLIRESGRVFLEAAPRGTEPDLVLGDLRQLDGVVGVHDLHLWEVTSGFAALSAHVLVAPDRDCHRTRIAAERMLAERYGIEHTTLQVDHRDTRQTLPTPSFRDHESSGSA